VAWWWGAPADHALTVFGYGVLVAVALGAFATNLFHGWAHAPAICRPVAWLQRHRLILSARVHAAHHHAGEGAYCVTVGWMNGWTDRLRLFPLLERALVAAGLPTATGVRL
jgi:TMEM189-like protein